MGLTGPIGPISLIIHSYGVCCLSKLADIHEYYAHNPLPPDLFQQVSGELGVRLEACYDDIGLKHPIIVAPGQVTLTVPGLRTLRRAGYAGCVLKSLVGEDVNGICKMIAQRKKPTHITTVYDPEDTAGACPVIHWDGRCDARTLSDYLPFASEARTLHEPGDFAVIASILCHLPRPGEDVSKEEWLHTTAAIADLGYTHIEIDFCPFLSSDDYTEDQRNVLDWYRTLPALMKSARANIKVYPKMLNLDWGLDYQIRIADAAVQGGADGLVVANRFFKKEYNSAHGGWELRKRNLAQVTAIHERFPELALSATGGVYAGEHVLAYLRAGARNVQVLSFIMGQVRTPFAKTDGTKSEKVLHKLLLDPVDGLFAALLRE